MGWYERCWTALAAAFCAAGLLAALHNFGLLAVIGLFISAAVLGLMTVLPWMETVAWRSKPLVIGGPVAGALVVVLVGLFRVAVMPTLVVAVLLALLSPWLLSWVARRRGGRRTTSRGAGAGDAPGPTAQRDDRPVLVEPAGVDLVVPDLMDLADLCQAWRSSFVALERAQSVGSRMRVVQMRALYLDELERRAGPALQAWFASGPRAAGDPGRFVLGAEKHLPPPVE